MISFVVVADVVDVVADVVVDVAVGDTVSADHITIALIMPGKRTCGKWTPDLGPLAWTPALGPLATGELGRCIDPGPRR